eukprot:COSAG02_NODE_68_length_42582_cov_52.351129_6_plen_303_part_00
MCGLAVGPPGPCCWYTWGAADHDRSMGVASEPSCMRRLAAIARTVRASAVSTTSEPSGSVTGTGGAEAAVPPPPFVPQPLLPGGIVRSLFDAATDAPLINKLRLHEPEVYNGGEWKPGDKIHGITNIHNPSFDIYPVAGPGCCVILVPGGGHRVLGVGGCTDLVTTFAARGISTVIVRCRLRVDGYDMSVDALNDTLRCISLVRANSAEWGLDPKRIGVIGMSAGAEHAAGAATEYEAFRCNGSLLHRVSPRPDFVGVLFSGPTLFEHDPALDSEGGGRYAGMSEQGAVGQAANDAQTAEER